MIKVSKIKNQLLSTALCDFYICPNCRIVDNNHERIRVGSYCSNCSETSKGATHYYPINVQALINLIQSEYHACCNARKTRNANLAILLSYNALKEALLNNLFCHLYLFNKEYDSYIEIL